ncbi:Premnaspirodiene oxygenase [Zea mays]|uniref:Premnaspirodiene oxygenase n=1 Tax=Zea mays TaxID=4577 RepID=A0A3L6EUM9_MAIZE|nr:Premnaspirodiene oxygenase [Zea mays]
MAAEPPAYLLLLPLIAIPLIVFLVLSRRRDDQRRFPPAPWALPVIGHLHHLAGAPPHRALRDLARRHGPLMTLRFCELRVVVASSPDAAREILRTHDVDFASRPIGPMLQLVFRGAEGLIFAPYGDGWRQLRKICTLELLSARRVHSFRPVREDEVGRLLGSVASAAAAGLPVNLSERITAFVADAAVRAIIGSRSEHRDEFLRLLMDGLKIIPGLSLPDLFPSSRLAMLVSSVPGKIERRRKGLLDIVDPIILEHQEKRAAGGIDEDEDLLDVLLRLQKDMDSQYPLTTDNIKSVLIDMFGASSETSATTLKWTMAELMRNPAVMRKAQDEVRGALAGHDEVAEDSLVNLRYLQLVIKETLRLHPPAPLLLPRECRSPCQVLGYDVPRGTMVLVNAWAIGRDPALWDAPEDFVPERFEESGRDFKGMDFEFIPFGAGRRMCPGMAFGLAHIELALAALLFHFDWKLPEGVVAEEIDMAEAVAITAPPRSDLVVLPVTRLPVSI